MSRKQTSALIRVATFFLLGSSIGWIATGMYWVAAWFFILFLVGLILLWQVEVTR